MNPGIIQRNKITERGIDYYERVLSKGSDLNVEFPTSKCQGAQRKLMAALMARSSNGMDGYHDINILASSIAHSGGVPTNVGFDGISWKSPETYGLTKLGVTKTVDKGFASTGINGGVRSAFKHRFIDSIEDFFIYTYFFNIYASVNATGVVDGTQSRAIAIYPKWSTAGSVQNKAYPIINGGAPSAAGYPTITDGSDHGMCGYTTVSGGNTKIGWEVDGVLIDEQTFTPTKALSTLNMYLLASTDNNQAFHTSIIQACQIYGYKSKVDTLGLHTDITTYLADLL